MHHVVPPVKIAAITRLNKPVPALRLSHHLIPIRSNVQIPRAHRRLLSTSKPIAKEKESQDSSSKSIAREPEVEAGRPYWTLFDPGRSQLFNGKSPLKKTSWVNVDIPKDPLEATARQSQSPPPIKSSWISTNLSSRHPRSLARPSSFPALSTPFVEKNDVNTSVHDDIPAQVGLHAIETAPQPLNEKLSPAETSWIKLNVPGHPPQKDLRPSLLTSSEKISIGADDGGLQTLDDVLNQIIRDGLETAPEQSMPLSDLSDTMAANSTSKDIPLHGQLFGGMHEQANKNQDLLDFIEHRFEIMTQQELLDSLRSLGDRGCFQETYDLAYKMLGDRGIPPSSTMFHALIMANASPEGSVAEVIRLLNEMEAEGIHLDQALSNAVLRVLAAHPDYVMRIEILQHMERRWFGLSEMGHLMVIASMFREMQLERAIQELQTMKNNQLKIPHWLYSLAVSILVQANEFDEAMKVMRLRLEDLGPQGLSSLWTYLLDTAAEAQHFMTCRYIWIRCVKPEYVNVSSGTCLHILNMAAREGDAEFATDVLRVVYRHHGIWFYEHWEMLVETHANAGDYKAALKTLVEMKQSGHSPDHNTTRSIHMAMQSDSTVTDEVRLDLFQYLIDDLSLIGKKVPVAAVNVIMEGCQRSEPAYSMYIRIRQASIEGPNLTTYHHQFYFARRSGDVKWAMKISREHKALGFEPDLYVYDGLIATLIQGRYDLDFIVLLYNEMRTMFPKPMFRTVQQVYLALKIRRDERAKDVLKDLEARFQNKHQKEKLEKVAESLSIKWQSKPNQYNEPTPVPIPAGRASAIGENLDKIRQNMASHIWPDRIDRPLVSPTIRWSPWGSSSDTPRSK